MSKELMGKIQGKSLWNVEKGPLERNIGTLSEHAGMQQGRLMPIWN